MAAVAKQSFKILHHHTITPLHHHTTAQFFIFFIFQLDSPRMNVNFFCFVFFLLVCTCGCLVESNIVTIKSTDRECQNQSVDVKVGLSEVTFLKVVSQSTIIVDFSNGYCDERSDDFYNANAWKFANEGEVFSKTFSNPRACITVCYKNSHLCMFEVEILIK
jgi:hypothetical protein